MKQIKCIIQPHKLEDVKAALVDMNVHGMTVTEVKGFGRQKGHKEVYRGAEYTVDFVPKIVIEVAAPDGMVKAVIEAVMKTARSGKVGDGKIFVTNVEEAVRIRTGESGEAAL